MEAVTGRYATTTVLCGLTTFTLHCFAASVGSAVPVAVPPEGVPVVPAGVTVIPNTDVPGRQTAVVAADDDTDEAEAINGTNDMTSSELDDWKFFTVGDATGKSCTPLEFRCKNDIQCIPDALACDGYPHCKDQSDEEKEMCLKHPCEDDDWIMCKSSGRCIRRSMVCDEIQDCDDGSDEDVYMCNKYDEMPDEKFFGDDSILGTKLLDAELLQYPS